MSGQEDSTQQINNNMSDEKQHISKEGLGDMKKETLRLIRQFCTVRKLSRWKYELYLHDSTRIEFTKFPPVEAERFCELVKEFAKVLDKLVVNLSYESETRYVEKEYVTGSIDFEKTRVLRQTDGSKLVCVEYSKNLFTHENVLLAAVILGVNTMATKFLEGRSEWEEKHKLEGQVEQLKGVISYTSFLQKDRKISKLAKYYYENFQGVERLLEKTAYRISTGRVHSKYRPLLQFVKIWRKYDQILQEGDKSLMTQLSGLEHFQTGSRIYEIWVFFKTLSLFFDKKPVKQKTGNDKHREFIIDPYTIEYQFHKRIGWERVDPPYSIGRFPDTIIKKDSNIIAMLDAKYMKYEDKLEGKDKPDQSPSMPDRNIVNQMIIEMEYGKPNDNTDIGIVLFADKRNRDTVVIEKSSGTPAKKIYFLNMHPENHPIDALNKVKQICDLK